MPQPLQVTFLVPCILSSVCLLNGSPHRKHFLLEPVEPVGEEELEFCSLETLDFLLLLSYA